MIRILNTAVLLILVISTEGKKYLRVVSGRDANPGEYPYVLPLYLKYLGNFSIPLEKGNFEYVLIRFCTGSLITSSWLLTAAHCLVDFKYPVEQIRVRYGDMTKLSHETKEFFKKILKTVPHPAYFPHRLSVSVMRDFKFINPNDIALIQTEEIPVQPLGRLSAVEYKTLMGLPVTYTGYGLTQFDVQAAMKDILKPRVLQIGEGGIVPCEKDKIPTIPGICVTTKCNEMKQYPQQGDSGGPLFYKNHIIAVYVIGYKDTENKRSVWSVYVPVSPYLEWIVSVIQ